MITGRAVDRMRRVVERELVPLAVEVEAAVPDAPGPGRHREAAEVVVVDVRRHQEVEPVHAQRHDPAASLRRDHQPRRPGLERQHGRSLARRRRYPRRSMTVAFAWPPPSHMVWKPKRPPVVSRWLSIVVIRRTPLAPSGCPIAMAPPRGLYFAGSGRNSLAHMSAMAANASLHSMASNSSTFMPVRPSSLRVTGFGADSTSTGSSARTAKCTNRARTGSPRRSAVARSAMSIAEAPSLIGDEFPAVMSGAGCSSDSHTAG